MATRTVGLESAESQRAFSVTRPVTRSRRAYFDNLKTVLITGVILAHLSVTYGVDADWYYYEGGDVSPVAYFVILMIIALGMGFAMGLFFMIAGYFTAGAYDRKGARRFLIDRLKRLGIPWLIFEVAINPFVHYIVDVHGGNCKGAFYDCQFHGSLWEYLGQYPSNLGSIGDGPVWFLEALLVFSVLYALWRRIAGSVTRPALSNAASAHTVPSNRMIALFALAIGLITFVVRFGATALVYYEPLHFEFAHFPQYIALFIAGLWAYRRGWFDTFTDRQAKTWGWVALGCVITLPLLVVAVGGLAGTLDARAGGGVNELSLAYSLWEGFLCVSMSVTLLSWFRRRFDQQGRLARAMSESSFSVYVVHPAVIVPLALVLSDIQMNLSLKYLLVAPIAVTLSYLVAYGLRRVPMARTVMG